MKVTRPRRYTAEQVFIPCAPSYAWHQEQRDSSYVKCSEDVCLYVVHLCTSKLPDPQGTHPTDQWCQLSIPFYNGGGSSESQHGYNRAHFSSPPSIGLTAGCHLLTFVYWIWRGPNRTLILKCCVPWRTITNLPEDYWSSCSLKLPPAYLPRTMFSFRSKCG